MKTILASLLLLGLALSADSLSLHMELQETTATFRGEWTYDCPVGASCSFIWWVTAEATGIVVERDTTGLNQTQEWIHNRTATDDAYLFHIDVYRVENGNFYPSGVVRTKRYVVPAREPWILVASSTETTRPDSIPHDPSQELSEGTLWLEFTPNVVVGNQGLWAKDYVGYQTGGHLSVWLRSDSLIIRIQDDSSSYEYKQGGVVAGQRNQVAIEFGPDGYKGWLNTTQSFSDPYTGGIVGNQNAIVVGAMSQGTEPWTNPLDGVMHTTELYDGKYDFSGRWDDVPIPPPPPICDTCVNVIRVANLRVWRGLTLPDTFTYIQYALAPAGYRYVDYRTDPPQTERLMYEVWSGGQKVGYSADADSGLHDCREVDNGEVCPVRPFRSRVRLLALLGSYWSLGMAGVL